MLPTVAILILVVALVCLFVLVDVAKSLRKLLQKRESVPKWDKLICAIQQLTSQIEEWPENSRLDLRLQGGCGPFQHYGHRLDGNYRLDHYRLDRLDHCRPDSTRLDHSVVVGMGGYAIWVFLHNKWQVAEDHCAEGFHPGEAPAVPGRYEGERVAQEAVAT